VRPRQPARTEKCTEPVTPSSGFPTDLRRSGCRSESHQPRTLRTRCKQHPRGCTTGRQAPEETNLPQIPANTLRSLELEPAWLSDVPIPARGRPSERPANWNPKRNAPSRWRLRPAFRLTSAEAGADRRAINLGRSVLGANSTLGGARERVKSHWRELHANCVFFFTQRSNCTQLCLFGRHSREENGPGSSPTRGKYSPSRERFRPPSRRTFRFRVVLLGGLRPTGAPCSAQAGLYASSAVSFKGSCERILSKLRPRTGRTRVV
jgi:hypothetical protein